MRLFLMRHGQAHPHAARDELRELTVIGQRDSEQIAARYLSENFTALWVSPYVRAQQTMACVQKGAGLAGKVQTLNFITPDDSPRYVIEQLQALTEEEGCYLLITHQPLVGRLISLLVDGQDLPLGVDTSSIAVLDMPVVASGCATLVARYSV
jgi:phosphohistidine phosphatase